MPRKPFTRLYRALLRLYPPGFQAEFAEEMVSVFEQAIEEAAGRGRLALLWTFLGEVCCLPGEALRLAFKALLGGTQARAGESGWEGPPTALETLLALAVFALPAAYLSLDTTSGENHAFLLPGMAGLLAAGFFTGLKRGFPRWSLPYLGMALSAISFVFVFQWTSDQSAPSSWAIPAELAFITPLMQDESLALVWQSFWAGLMWLSLFTLTFLVLGLLALLRRFNSLLTRLRQDWTLVSYILYTGTLFTLGLTFDQSQGQHPYALASSLCLLTGAWLYLNSARPWQRTLSLLVGITLATMGAFANQWPVQLIQDWGSWLGGQPQAGAGWSDLRQTILVWGWMVLVLLAPALIRLPRGARGRSPTVP